MKLIINGAGYVGQANGTDLADHVDADLEAASRGVRADPRINHGISSAGCKFCAAQG